MSNQIERVYEGVVIDEDEYISLTHLCQYCNHSQEEIVELVDEGILEPIGGLKQEWRFSYKAITRVKKVRRLQKDFELELSASGLVIHLLDRIEELESRLINRGC
ncbi:MAG: chaperone modulator CbpM [Bacteroidales bacterium]|nr:chaperone modulator CbpM [Bacteroidales bacterium]